MLLKHLYITVYYYRVKQRCLSVIVVQYSVVIFSLGHVGNAAMRTYAITYSLNPKQTCNEAFTHPQKELTMVLMKHKLHHKVLPANFVLDLYYLCNVLLNIMMAVHGHCLYSALVVSSHNKYILLWLALECQFEAYLFYMAA